MIKSPM